MSVARTLGKLDFLADTIRATEKALADGDIDETTWKLSTLALTTRWLIEDLEKELEASAE